MVDEPVHQTTHSKNAKARGQPGLFVSIWQEALDWLFPPRCAGCGRVDTDWCPRCQQAIDALPLLLLVDKHLPVIASAATGWHTGRLRAAIHALKYEDNRAVAAVLGERLAQCLQSLDWTFDIIVPVPLHTSRLYQRGYNQANLLAETVAKRLVIPCLPTALHRHRYTPSQVGLTRNQRQTNVHGAFTASPELITGRQILLIDDVLTTGATLTACAQALTATGARGIYALTVTAARN